MDAIATAGRTRTFVTKRVVDDLTLTVRQGDIYGFVGRNGSGKSTVMKMICGLVPQTAGTVRIFGEQFAPGTTSRRIGAVIEDPGFYPGFTGLDNVRCRALSLGLPDEKAASARALEQVGLAEVARKKAKAYSLGMKQRLGLAMALVGSPDILMLDEPFNGLDPQVVREVRSLIVRLAETRGVTVFISSHVLDQLERMVTRYGVIREGRLVREVTAAEVEAECADYLNVRCADTELALSVLQTAFPQAVFSVMPDNALHVSGGVVPQEAGRALAQKGIVVEELYVHERDIEEYFVALMGGEAESAAAPTRRKAAKGGGRRA